LEEKVWPGIAAPSLRTQNIRVAKSDSAKLSVERVGKEWDKQDKRPLLHDEQKEMYDS